MSNEANAALAELGLGDLVTDTTTQVVAETAPVAGADATAAAVVEGQTAPAQAEEPKKRHQVEIASITVGEADELPELVRKGFGAGERAPRESKYDFTVLAAPTDKGNGKFGYAFIRVVGAEGEDPKAVARAVQSAATAANKAGKEEGKYFVTRTAYAKDEAGNTTDKSIGIDVYRIDNTLGNLNAK